VFTAPIAIVARPARGRRAAALLAAAWLAVPVAARAAPGEAARPAQPARAGAEVFRDCPVCPEMVTVPGGRFRMGSPADEEGRQESEDPPHRVTVTGFAIGRTEVTRGQYAAFVKETGHPPAERCWTNEAGKYEERAGRDWRNPGFAQDDTHPVVCVSWNDAQAYVRWLSRKTGRAYRLPSEAQWEYAARAGSSTARYWGESADRACEHANVADESLRPTRALPPNWPLHACDDGHARTAPAGRYVPNACGLHDMIGNAREWTEDCWHDDHAGAPVDGSARAAPGCVTRVLKGGAWISIPSLARSGTRIKNAANRRYDVFGFRVVR
jgi:sulfatase modifying factor 1